LAAYLGSKYSNRKIIILRKACLVLLCCTFMLGGTVSAEEALSSEQGDAILKELKGIKSLLQQMVNQNKSQRKPARKKPSKAKVGTQGGYVLGQNDAPVTLVEYTDFQCPFCRRFHDQVFPGLKKKYIDTGKLRYISRDLPLGFHKYANTAALAGRCAGEQDKFWEFRHVLFENSKKLGRKDIDSYALKMGLDINVFKACVDSKKYQTEVNRDVSDAHAAGFTGTPSFVLGATGDGRKVDGIAIVGAKPLAFMEAKIKDILSKRQ